MKLIYTLDVQSTMDSNGQLVQHGISRSEWQLADGESLRDVFLSVYVEDAEGNKLPLIQK